MAKEQSLSKVNKTNLPEVQQASGYLIVGNKAVLDDIASGLSEQDFMFQKISNPAVGGFTFEVVDDDGNPQAVTEVTGIILHAGPTNFYYDKPYDGEGKPPTCVSMDGVTGVGDPGGECSGCLYNTYQSGKNGKSEKQCKNKYRIFLLQEGNYLPHLMYIPSTNVKAAKLHKTIMLRQGKRLNTLVTTISIARKTGGKYAAFEFRRVRDLTPEERAVVDPLADLIRQHAERMNYEVESADSDSNFIVDPETGEIIQQSPGGNS